MTYAEAQCEVHRRHLEFTRGMVEEPCAHVSGLAFYQVGRNATHTFWLAVRDGKFILRSTWGAEDADGLPTTEEDVSEIERLDGCYLGHF